MTELATAVGVSPSLISQIEHGQSQPSVSTLFGLSEALNVPVDAFFESEPAAGTPELSAPDGAPAPAAPKPDAQPEALPTPMSAVQAITTPHPPETSASVDREHPGRAAHYVVRRDARAALDIEGGVRWERLTPDTLSQVEFLELVYAPGAQSHSELYRHPGTEMVLVLSGRLDIYVGFERYEMDAGDSIQFPSTMPHRYVNPTDHETRAVTVIHHDGS